MMIRGLRQWSGSMVALVAAIALGSALGVSAGEPTADDLQTIEALIREHGKAPFIKMILAERTGRITLESGRNLKTGYGPPNERFVSAATIALDLEAIGAGTDDLVGLLSPYVEDGGQPNKGGSFVVSDANLATVAGRGRVSGSDSTSHLETTNNPGIEDENSGGSINGQSEIDEDLHRKLNELRRRAAALEIEINQMRLHREDSGKISAKQAELSRIQSEIQRTNNGLLKRERENYRRQDRDPTDEESKKAYWVSMMKRALEDVRSAKAKIESLEKLLAEAMEQARFFGKEQPSYIDQWGIRRTKTRGPYEIAKDERVGEVRRLLSKAHRDLASAEERLERIKIEARRDNAKPGWFRGLE